MGKTKRILKVGSRAQVFHGVAEKTSGGLRREDLTKNTRGRIVSISRQTHGMRLYKAAGGAPTAPGPGPRRKTSTAPAIEPLVVEDLPPEI